MARVFIDGFESGNCNAWDDFGSNALVAGTYKYNGNYGVYLQNSTIAFVRKFIPSTSTLYCAFKYNASTGNRGLCSWGETGVNHTNIYMTDSGGKAYFEARRASTILANSLPYYVIHNTWYLVEVYVYIHDTSGRFQIKVDGITVLDFTGDTRNAGTGVITQFCMGYDSLIGSAATAYIDDVVLDDANWIGDTAVLGLSPDGAGATTQWDPSTGSNYACVDEVPQSDTDYVSTNVNDEIDTYTLANLPTVQSVKAVQVMARARKEGVSTPQNIALVARIGGTDYPSSDHALSTAFIGHTNLWQNNPNTAAAWTESEVNSLQAGVKSRA